MQGWKTTRAEPSLDELLRDEPVKIALRSAGVTADELRSELADLACRLVRRNERCTGNVAAGESLIEAAA